MLPNYCPLFENKVRFSNIILISESQIKELRQLFISKFAKVMFTLEKGNNYWQMRLKKKNVELFTST